jgi:putative mRNA 3-end processing factor
MIPFRETKAEAKVDLIVARPQGLYCPQGDFFIDPTSGVERAVITHAHSDHARYGSAAYLCHDLSAPILRQRLGEVSLQTLAYGEPVVIDGVRVSLHPAGHIVGSAQIRVEYGGRVWVASGDYKIEADGVSAAFEPISCDAFITESTFGLPIYRWRAQAEIMDSINDWWRHNADTGRASVMFAYALGKAQRILKHLDLTIGPIVCHGAVEELNMLHRGMGVDLPSTLRLTESHNRDAMKRAFVLAPPSAFGGGWLRRFAEYSDAFASGWMQVRGNRRRRGVDRGFTLSDHADWPALLQAISATGAERVFVTHGTVGPLVRYLRENGVNAAPIETNYGEDEDAVVAADAS